MASLDKTARDALPDSDFAVPGKRKLPMHDATHAQLAWDMIDRATGLSDAERGEARERVKNRAQSLGIDTSAWHITASFAFQAMALDMPDVQDHPNKMPFKGVLTRVNQPSDLPPGGARKRTMMPSDVAEAAIPTLLGMAVDFTKDFDGHDRQCKIGLITGACVVGDAVEIEGFFYAKDFPEECKRIRTEKGALGFSFEADARIQDVDADIWVIEHCVFTGAAVLYKDLAAYTTTSLAAKAEQDIEMNEEQMKALLASAITAAVAPLAASIAKQGEDLTAMQKTIDAKGASLAGPIIDQVKPHVDSINAAADAMEKAGIGTHSENGHVRHMRNIAAHMCASAVGGNVPNIYRDHDFLPGARIEAGKQAPSTEELAAAAAKDKMVTDLSETVANLTTKLTDLSAKGFAAAPAPGRATLSPEIKTLLAKGGVKDDDVKDGKLSHAQVNAMLDAGGIKGNKAIEMKLKLRHDGLMPV